MMLNFLTQLECINGYLSPKESLNGENLERIKGIQQCLELIHFVLFRSREVKTKTASLLLLQSLKVLGWFDSF